MENFYATVPYLFMVLLVGTVGVLIVGVVAMGSPRVSPATRNKIMRLRVGIHGVAVLLMLLLLALSYWQPGT